MILGLATLPRLLMTGTACLAIGLAVGEWHGRSVASAKATARAMEATVNQMKERGLINEAVRNTDLSDLCVELGGLRDDCRQ